MTLEVSSPRLPFRVDRQAEKTLTEQVVEGLREAILTRRFKPGDTLPTKLEMAAELGVNDITIRRALAQLKREGLIAPRPRRGILVCDPTRHSWRGHVLIASWSGPDMYYHTVMAAEITRRLHAQRFLVTDLHLDGAAHASEYAETRGILETRSVDLVLVEGGGWIEFQGRGPTVWEVLKRFRLPVVYVDAVHPTEEAPLRPDIGLSTADAFEALAVHIRECGIRSALLAAKGKPRFARRHPVRQLARRLEAEGISCDWLEVTPVAGLRSPESVERGGLAAMMQWLDERLGHQAVEMDVASGPGDVAEKAAVRGRPAVLGGGHSRVGRLVRLQTQPCGRAAPTQSEGGDARLYWEGDTVEPDVSSGSLALWRTSRAGSSRPGLPDLIYFDDDFLARGALLALTRRGIRIPEDVQVATWANKGLGPVFDKPLTRIEMDPVAHGAAIAEHVLRYLSDRVALPPIELTPEFIVGETTRLRQDSAGRASRGVLGVIDRRLGSRAGGPAVLEGRSRAGRIVRLQRQPCRRPGCTADGGTVEPGVSHGSKHGPAGSEQDGPPGSEGRGTVERRSQERRMQR